MSSWIFCCGTSGSGILLLQVLEASLQSADGLLQAKPDLEAATVSFTLSEFPGGHATWIRLHVYPSGNHHSSC